MIGDVTVRPRPDDLRLRRVAVFLLALLACLLPCRAEGGLESAVRSALSEVRFEALPTAKGETAFIVRGARYPASIRGCQANLSLPAENGKANSIGLRFVGCNPPEAQGEGELSSISHYFLGGNAAGWQHNVRNFSRVRLTRVYDGVDALFHGSDGSLEFDLQVERPERLKSVRLEFSSPIAPRLDASGALLIERDSEILRLRRPVAYQLRSGTPTPVTVDFVVREDGLVGLAPRQADPDLALVVDPILDYASYIGGSAEDRGRVVATDSSGNIYVAGFTLSSDFLVEGAFQDSGKGDQDAFLMKLDPEDYSVIFSTYLGGTDNDRALDLGFDDKGNIYLAGVTESLQFPTASPVQATLRGNFDYFVSRFSPNGASLPFSTYFGGSGQENLARILVESSGAFVLVGWTTSRNYPLANAFSGTLAGPDDIVITRIDFNGVLQFSSFLGGSSFDRAYGADVDSNGAVIVTGETLSTDFPVMNGFQAQLKGPRDAFVTQIDPLGFQIVSSTYLGGGDSDWGRRVILDAFDQIYVVGETTSDDFPSVQPLQANRKDKRDFFVTLLAAKASAPLFSTYLGGSGDEFVGAASLDGQSRLYLAGWTGSDDLPTRSPSQANAGGGLDGYLAHIGTSPTELISATYFGGGGDDRIQSSAVDAKGALLVVGESLSSDLPITSDAADATMGGLADAFLARFAETSDLHFAQFGDGTEAGASISSRIEILNPDPVVPAAVRMLLRDDAGDPLSVDFNGIVFEGELEFVVPAGGNVRLATDGEGPLVTGSVRALSDHPVSGFIFFDTGPAGATGVASSPRLKELLAPIESGEGINTGIAFAGFAAGQTIHLVLRDSQGIVRGQSDLNLAAFGHRALFVNELQWTPPVDFSSFNGNLIATSPQEFTATVIRTSPGQLVILPVAPLG